MIVSFELDPSDFSIIDITSEGSSIINNRFILSAINRGIYTCISKSNQDFSKNMHSVSLPTIPEQMKILESRKGKDRFKVSSEEQFNHIIGKLSSDKFDTSKLRFNELDKEIEVYCPVHNEWKPVSLITNSDCKSCNEAKLVTSIKGLLLNQNSK